MDDEMSSVEIVVEGEIDEEIETTGMAVVDMIGMPLRDGMKIAARVLGETLLHNLDMKVMG